MVAIQTENSTEGNRTVLVSAGSSSSSSKKRGDKRMLLDCELVFDHGNINSSAKPEVRELCALLGRPDLNFASDLFNAMFKKHTQGIKTTGPTKIQLLCDKGEDAEHHYILLYAPGTLEGTSTKLLLANTQSNQSNTNRFRIRGKRKLPDYVNTNVLYVGEFENIIDIPVGVCLDVAHQPTKANNLLTIVDGIIHVRFVKQKNEEQDSQPLE